jgi:hypothetical protein
MFDLLIEVFREEIPSGSTFNSGCRKAETISGFHVSIAVSVILWVRKVRDHGRTARTSVVIFCRSAYQNPSFVKKIRRRTSSSKLARQGLFPFDGTHDHIPILPVDIVVFVHRCNTLHIGREHGRIPVDLLADPLGQTAGWVRTTTTYQNRPRHSVGFYSTQFFHYVLVGPEVDLTGFEYPKGIYARRQKGTLEQM